MNEREQLQQLDALVRDNQLDRAAELGKELSGAFPDSFQVQFTYAGVLRRLDELDRAREILVELQRRYPDNINLLLALAEIARRRRDTAAAREHYNKILFLDPFNQAAKDALAALGAPAAAAPPPPAAAARQPTPKRVEVDLEGAEPGADFMIRLDEVRPDDTPTLDLDEAGIPKPEVAEPEDTGPAIPEFGMPLESPGESVPQTPPPAPEPFREPAGESRPPTAAPDPAEADVLRIPFEEIPAPPVPDLTDTAPLRVDSAYPEAAEEAEEEAASADEGVEFFTESAAGLYVAQGLWAEAVEIYRELHRRSQDDRYLARIRELEHRRVNLAKIERLKRLLADIKARNGEDAGV